MLQLVLPVQSQNTSYTRTAASDTTTEIQSRFDQHGTWGIAKLQTASHLRAQMPPPQPRRIVKAVSSSTLI